MADISKITVNNTTYNIKDTTARREASASQSGIVSTGEQTFSGNKIFEASRLRVLSGNTEVPMVSVGEKNRDLRVAIEVGVASENHGLYSNGYYDATNNKFTSDGTWIAYRDGNGAIHLNGEANSAKAVPWSGVSSKPSTSIATSTGTNQRTLGFGKKYSITAAGSSYIFTMPPYQIKSYTYTYGQIAASSEVSITATNLGVSTPSGYTPVAATYYTGGNKNVVPRYINVEATGSSAVMILKNITSSATSDNLIAGIKILYIYTG